MEVEPLGRMSPKKLGDLNVVSAPVRFVSSVQRLMGVTHEMNQKFEGILFVSRRRLGIAEDFLATLNAADNRFAVIRVGLGIESISGHVREMKFGRSTRVVNVEVGEDVDGHLGCASDLVCPNRRLLHAFWTDRSRAGPEELVHLDARACVKVEIGNVGDNFMPFFSPTERRERQQENRQDQVPKHGSKMDCHRRLIKARGQFAPLNSLKTCKDSYGVATPSQRSMAYCPMKPTISDARFDDLNLRHGQALQSGRGVDLGGEIEPLSRRQIVLSWVFRLIAASILLETLYFKFTGHPESVWIFSTMHMEAWGRYGQGIWELMASILLFVPNMAWLGALLALGAMGSAIMSHLGVLGIVVQDDHGLLFGMACVTFVSSVVVLWIHQRSVPNISRLDDFPE